MNQQESNLIVALPIAAATPLAYAFVNRIAVERDIRVLAIKGPILHKLGLRSQKISSDADILVDPSRMTEFCDVLAQYGWTEREVRFSPSILEPHSRTLIHPKWPCDIDVHSYFPGFFGNAREVFDLLWETKVESELAGLAVWTPNRVANGVIALLHVLRNSPSVQDNTQYRELMAALEKDMDPEQLAMLGRLADAGRFRQVMEAELARLGLGGSFKDLDPGELARWQIHRRTSPEATTGGWLYAIKAADWKSKIGIFLTAVYPSAEELRKDPGMAELGHFGIAILRMRRLARGMRSLPSASLSLLKNRGLNE